MDPRGTPGNMGKFGELLLMLSSTLVLLDFSLTAKVATLIIIPGCGWDISSAKEGKSGFIYNLVKS